MKLSAIQYKPPKAQTQTARGELLHLVEQSAKQGADIIVCPEMAVWWHVFESKAHIRPHCERADGPTARESCEDSQDPSLVDCLWYCRRGVRWNLI